ncbi:hypothetical protein BS47DRAFT_1399630 [Hydnum rufescens UP504]|uniref:Uncharacterized protein n=1 Tax=Hydnum rufescens UP504 TaxID=1448309 RepID=A0A9P6AI67_9AGAM|nr:hypothetical protein BS47DRAFT_1399630 [Hydnum rufescens UP504]
MESEDTEEDIPMDPELSKDSYISMHPDLLTSPPPSPALSVMLERSPSVDHILDNGILAAEEENYDNFGDVDTSLSHSTKKPFLPAPSFNDAKSTLHDLQEILKPPQKTGPGYKDPELGLMYQGRLEMMVILLNLYIKSLKGCNGSTAAAWTHTSLIAAKAVGKGPWLAR